MLKWPFLQDDWCTAVYNIKITRPILKVILWFNHSLDRQFYN